ncbi:MAG TPA: sugar transferase [Abditibacteriaceae bacterium]|jgi:lipopolysaccharide/colanic/teichoic acid biosynthesis glycosyltransferase
MNSVSFKQSKGRKYQRSVQPFDRYIQRHTPGARAFTVAQSFVAARGMAAKRLTSRAGVEPVKNLGIKLKGQHAQKIERAKSLHQPLVPRRVLIAGKHEQGCHLAQEFYRHFPQAYTVVGLVTDAPSSLEQVEQSDSHIALRNEVPVVGHIGDGPEVLRHHQIDEVLIADYFSPDFKLWEPQLASWAASPDEVREKRQQNAYHAVKRVLDIVFSFLGLLLVAPLLVVVGLLHKALAPGPVFFTQIRVGQNGRCFEIYKLRTMKLDAEKESGPVLAQHRDPRCTPLGAFLRATKIDELPQLFNVLRGDMSLVGPRPERPVFVEMYQRYIPRYTDRHQVRPGLTGLAQVNGDQLTHVNVKLHYDLAYVQNCGFSLDLKLLARTPLVILKALLVKSQGSEKRPLLNPEPKPSPVAA